MKSLYKRKFPVRTQEEIVTDVLRLSPDQYATTAPDASFADLPAPGPCDAVVCRYASLTLLDMMDRSLEHNVLKLFSTAIDAVRNRVYVSGIMTTHIGVLDYPFDSRTEGDARSIQFVVDPYHDSEQGNATRKLACSLDLVLAGREFQAILFCSQLIPGHSLYVNTASRMSRRLCLRGSLPSSVLRI